MSRNISLMSLAKPTSSRSVTPLTPRPSEVEWRSVSSLVASPSGPSETCRPATHGKGKHNVHGDGQNRLTIECIVGHKPCETQYSERRREQRWVQIYNAVAAQSCSRSVYWQPPLPKKKTSLSERGNGRVRTLACKPISRGSARSDPASWSPLSPAAAPR